MSTNPVDIRSDCVVVGASFAGLACATALATNGMQPVGRNNRRALRRMYCVIPVHYASLHGPQQDRKAILCRLRPLS